MAGACPLSATHAAASDPDAIPAILVPTRFDRLCASQDISQFSALRPAMPAQSSPSISCSHISGEHLSSRTSDLPANRRPRSGFLAHRVRPTPECCTRFASRQFHKAATPGTKLGISPCSKRLLAASPLSNLNVRSHTCSALVRALLFALSSFRSRCGLWPHFSWSLFSFVEYPAFTRATTFSSKLPVRVCCWSSRTVWWLPKQD